MTRGRLAGRLAVVTVALACVLPRLAGAQTPDELQKRRQAVRDAMDPDSVLVLRSPVVSGEGDFRQDNNLYYLTGVTEPGAALVLYASRRQGMPGAAGRAGGAGMPAGMRGGMAGRTEVLFLAPEVPADVPPARGASAAPAAAPARPGFAVVRPAAEFQAAFESALLSATGTVYLDYQRSRSLSAPLTPDEQLLKAARDRGAAFTVKPAAALVSPLRRIKSAGEIATLRVAADITAAAEREAMRAAQPGMYEYQIQSIIEHVFSMNGARRVGFPTIVGSGENSCILHWSENTRKTEPGDMVVMDIGAEYDMYTADITRTIPVSGTFTKHQREIYELVLRANEEAIKMVAPGVNMNAISSRVNDVLAEGLIALGILQDKSGLRQYYPHGLSHPVGLQVHDVGGLGVLEPGMIVTIEPGLYLREEDLGVRIEDDVLVTPGGHEVITAAAPKAVADVERLMKEDGIDFQRYLLQPVRRQ